MVLKESKHQDKGLSNTQPFRISIGYTPNAGDEEMNRAKSPLPKVFGLIEVTEVLVDHYKEV